MKNPLSITTDKRRAHETVTRRITFDDFFRDPNNTGKPLAIPKDISNAQLLDIRNSNYNPEQEWISFACEVSPNNGSGGENSYQWQPLITQLTPWRAYIDLTGIEYSDHFIIQTEIRVHSPNSIPRYPKDARGYIWVLDDRLAITLRKANSGEPDSIHVNGSPLSFNKILSVEPLSGPWEARLSIAQVQGISKKLRVLTL